MGPVTFAHCEDSATVRIRLEQWRTEASTRRRFYQEWLATQVVVASVHVDRSRTEETVWRDG